jgi:Leucine-rich repeat (LRR) protein
MKLSGILPELQAEILRLISTKNLCRVSQVCQRWSKIAKEELRERKTKKLTVLLSSFPKKRILPEKYVKGHPFAGEKIDYTKVEILHIETEKERGPVPLNLSRYSQVLSNLKILDCSHCRLISLNVTGLSNLKKLYCSWNRLSSIEGLSTLTNLEYLDCYENGITSLDLSTLSNLSQVMCSNNKLTSLILPSQSNLKELYCSHNKLRQLNLEGQNLKYLYCSYNSNLSTIV